jgi:DNA polymerase I-like protein with 3'-5' exonuclease and polymerase domains
MIEAWNGDGDFYRRVGADLGISITRPELKVLVLASQYGQSARSAAERLGMEPFQAISLLNRFFDRYSQLAEGMKMTEDLAEVRGYAETRTGLKRYLNPKRSRHARGRQARNLPVQGGGADVLKGLLPRAQTILQRIDGRILVPLFDSLIFQVPREAQQEAVTAIRHEMVVAARSIYPELKPKLDVNDKDTSCWNKDGHGDSIDTFERDLSYDIF